MKTIIENSKTLRLVAENKKENELLKKWEHKRGVFTPLAIHHADMQEHFIYICDSDKELKKFYKN